jgi:superfamily II RNA helicase
MSAAAGALLARVPLGAPLSDPGAILDRFLDWVASQGLEPYPAQEQALLELMAGRHVVLDTPTGSGKSLVALGLHFKALCEGRRSFYTAPIKALVSEKFFALCDLFGAAQVGMLTGDASINWAAPVVCCTAEVLSNMALRQGEATDAPYVVMDEFHYYGDRDRGSAWQIPLLVLRRSQFLLMSATLGNTAPIEERLRADTGREVAHVWSDHRPVPLDFDYRETPLQETVEDLREEGRAPVYVVSFTQRECAELAQALTSAHVCSREERQVLAGEIAELRFDTPYGKDVRRFLAHGVGLHHAGLLPKYRLLVEQLSQRGLLKVICGTDTLGVGVNIPIRSVLFSKLCKYDGEKVRLLTVREFKQIAGRAGRKGFDDQGSVVCQAPEHVTRNRRAAERAGREGARRPAKRPPPSRGFVPWNRDVFQQLIKRPCEALRSQFRVSHGMLVSVLQREDDTAARRGSGAWRGRGGYHALAELIERCHEEPRRKRRLRREAAVLFRSLRRAGIVEVTRDPATRRARVRVDVELQRDFSLHQTLSLYLVEALSALDPTAPDYALDVLSLVEAVLENPGPILQAQVRRLRDDLMAKLKAEGVPFEDRLARLEEVSHPKPGEDFIYATFNLFAEHHPWVGRENIQPKAVAREMVQEWIRFDDYVRRYGIQRVEGLLLRYLGQVWSTLERSVPDAAKSDEIHDVLAYLGTLIERVDSSLLEEWQSLVHPERRPAREGAAAAPGREETGPRAFRARVRAELHALVQALSQRDFEEAALRVRQDPDEPWDAARFEAALAPYFAEYPEIRFDPEARQSRLTLIKPAGPHRFDVVQTLLDPGGEGLWCIEGEIDLAPGRDLEGPLLRVRRIGT